jgi:hypothetical protein
LRGVGAPAFDPARLQPGAALAGDAHGNLPTSGGAGLAPGGRTAGAAGSAPAQARFEERAVIDGNACRKLERAHVSGGHLRSVSDVLASAAEPVDQFWADFGDREPDGDGAPPAVMPPGCPVEPLGTEGNIFYFLTALGELRGLAADKVANKHIVGMFAPYTQYLFDQWPRKKLVKDEDGNEEWIVTGWRADDVSMELMKVAATRGVWNARDKVRGRGAWTDEDGRLILHCGNHVLAGGGWQKPGVIDGMVYPTAPAIPRPGPKPTFTIDEDGRATEVNAAEELLKWLGTWNWSRPGIDARLALGWITIARLGGALDWRTLIWITGGAGTGKSTLMDLIKALFDGGLLKLGSATEAAIRQLLGQDTLPVLLDETEAEEDDRKLQAILSLARIAASGDDIGKGGQDHQGVKFTARSNFVFSSILIPPLVPADKSRFVVLELKELPAGARAPKIKASEKRAMCAALTRRLVDQWSRWEPVLEAYREALIDYGGHKARGADVFGTLLAAAHLVLDDGAPDEEELAIWGRRLAAANLAELSDNGNDGDRCLHHLGTTLVQLAGHGQQRLISDWVDQAMTPDIAAEADERRRSAREQLAKIGLGIFVGKARDGPLDRERVQPVPGRAYIVIANAHQGLGRLFAETPWKGSAAAGGGWAQSLKRVPGAVPNERQRIAKKLMAVTLVPVDAMFDPDGHRETVRVEAEIEAAAAAMEAERV